MNAVDLQVDKIKTSVEGMRTTMMEVEETHTGGKGIYNQWIHCDLIVIF